MNNCIGKRNIRQFVFLIINSTILSLFILLSIISVPGWRGWVLFILSMILTGLFVNLLVFHVKRIMEGSTSYEYEKSIESNEIYYPFSLGTWRLNLHAFLHVPVDVSKVTDVRADIKGKSCRLQQGEEIKGLVDGQEEQE